LAEREVLNWNTGEWGYVPAKKMKRRHYVYSAVAERPGTEDGSIKLELLIRARPDSLTREAKQREIDWKTVIKISLMNTRYLISYCSKAMLFDYTLQDIEPENYRRFVFRYDYSSPDRSHIRQLAWYRPWKKYDFDEWIVIGKEWFTGGGGTWFPSEKNPGREKLQIMLSPSYVLESVEGLTPNSINEYRYQNDLVIEFRYKLKKLSGWLESVSGVCGSKKGKCEGTLWIDASSKNLIKSTTTVRGIGANETELNLEWDQAFGGYDEKIHVYPPESLQAERKKDGTLAIKEGKKSYVPFHDC